MSNDFREFSAFYNENYLMHYGRKGMRWGKSLFQDDYDPIGEVAKGLTDAYNYARQVGGRAAQAGRNAYNYAGQMARNLGDDFDREVSGSSYRRNAEEAQRQARLYTARAKQGLTDYKRALMAPSNVNNAANAQLIKTLESLGLSPADIRRQRNNNRNQAMQARRTQSYNNAMYNTTVAGRAGQAVNNARQSARDAAYNTAHQARQLVDDASHYAREGVDNVNKQLFLAKNMASVLPSAAKQTLNNVRQNASNVVDQLKDQFSRVDQGDQRVNNRTTATHDVKVNASSSPNEVINRAKQTLNNVQSEAERLGSKTNIVINGTAHKIRGLTDRISEAAQRKGMLLVHDIINRLAGAKSVGRYTKPNPNDDWYRIIADGKGGHREISAKKRRGKIR
jgi:archaellum component FlaC